jgi:hypothetical protein
MPAEDDAAETALQKGRRETEEERIDRNWNELLQELRVAQTGVQIFFAFLLGITFTQRFPDITEFQRALFVAILLGATAAAVLLIAPVSFHRIVFRQRRKAELVDRGNRLAIAGIAVLGLTLLGSVLLALDVALSGWLPFVLTGVMALWFLVFWYIVPLRYRRSSLIDDRMPGGSPDG